jgi:hypothetical protein
MRLLLKSVLVIGALLILGAGILAWRLSQRPISLAPFQPILESLLERGSPFLLTFAQPSLVWLRDENAAALEVRDVEARTKEGQLVASAPMLRGTIAVGPLLLERRIDLVEVQLDLPEIQLTRGDDGKLVLSFAGQLAAVPLGQAAGGGGLEALFGDATGAADPRLAELRLVQVTAPSLQFVDTASGKHATATDAAFELTREGGIWRASLGARLGDGRIEATGEPAATPPQQQLTLELQDFLANDLAVFAPDLPLAGLALPVSGSVRFLLDPSAATVGAGTIDLTTGSGKVGAPALGLPPIAVRRGELRARVETGWRRGAIDRLELVTDEFTLGLSGTLGEVDGRFQADVKLDATDLNVAEVLQLWPEKVAGEARGWVAGNVTAGQFTAATLRVADQSPHPDQLDVGGGFGFSGVTVRYLETMPPATGLAGTASLAGDSLAFTVTGGRTGEVEIGKGDVALSNLLGEGIAQLQAKAELNSTVPAAMRLLDAEPVALGKATGLSPQAAKGRQATKLEIGLPLLDEIPAGRIRYKATTRLTDLEVSDVRPGYGVTAKTLAVAADQAGVSAKGDVRLNGVPLTVDWRENAAPVKGVQRQVKATGKLDAAAAKALRFDWPSAVAGSVGVDATMVEGRSPLRTVDVALDLRGASVHVPGIVLWKRQGEPGSASAKLVQPDEGRLTVDQAKVDVAGWLAEGGAALQLDPLRPERLSIARLRTPHGDLTGQVALERGVWRGRVDVGRLDVRPLLQADGPAGSGASLEVPDLALQVSAQRLRFGDAPLSRLSGSVERRGGIWRTAKLRGHVEDSEVSLDLDTPKQRSALTVRGSDAGWLIRAFASSDRGVRGGTFRLSADLDQARTATSGSGELKIRDFTMWGAPTIARIVSLASFSGLGNALSGRGVPVTRLVIPFELQGERLRIDQARLVGSDIGARADGTIDFATDRLDISGTVAPAYTVNRILARVPILGQIMSGGRSDAALAATFSVTGSLADPQVSVNPLAALVPGLVRDLFGALTADDRSDLARTDSR